WTFLAPRGLQISTKLGGRQLDLSHQREFDGPPGDGSDLDVEGREVVGHGRQLSGDGEREFAGAVQTEEPAQAGVVEVEVDGELAEVQEVGGRGARVPIEVTPAPLAVLPARPPRNAGEDDRRRRVRPRPERRQAVL